MIAWSLLLSTPFLVVAPLLTGWPFVVLLAIGGIFLQSTLPVNVVFGQALAPVSAATVSSLMMGFGWGTGGLSVPIVGMIADRIGIAPTLSGLALVPLLAAACTWPLPHAGRPTHAAPVRSLAAPTRTVRRVWYDTREKPARCPATRATRPSATPFGPGPITPAVKWIIIANVAMFVITLVAPSVVEFLGLIPQRVIGQRLDLAARHLHVPARGIGHILFNMLGVWMFGVELERIWGTRFFSTTTRSPVSAAASRCCWCRCCRSRQGRTDLRSVTIGASGALFGLLLAFALYYPERPILMMMISPSRHGCS